MSSVGHRAAHVGHDSDTWKEEFGPGIAGISGGNVDVAGIVVSDNSEDGINLIGNAQLTFLPPNTRVLVGNGGAAINRDSTSVFVGDKTGVGKLACHITAVSLESAEQAARRSMRGAEDEDRPAKLRRNKVKSMFPLADSNRPT